MNSEVIMRNEVYSKVDDLIEVLESKGLNQEDIIRFVLLVLEGITDNLNGYF